MLRDARVVACWAFSDAKAVGAATTASMVLPKRSRARVSSEAAAAAARTGCGDRSASDGACCAPGTAAPVDWPQQRRTVSAMMPAPPYRLAASSVLTVVSAQIDVYGAATTPATFAVQGAIVADVDRDSGNAPCASAPCQSSRSPHALCESRERGARSRGSRSTPIADRCVPLQIGRISAAQRRKPVLPAEAGQHALRPSRCAALPSGPVRIAAHAPHRIAAAARRSPNDTIGVALDARLSVTSDSTCGGCAD